MRVQSDVEAECAQADEHRVTLASHVSPPPAIGPARIKVNESINGRNYDQLLE